MTKMRLRDYVDINFDASKLTRTKEGYLTGMVCTTGAGVFRYLGNDGVSVVPRLRPREEVIKSLDSLANKPITYNHPEDFVTPENSKTLSVGMSDKDVQWDGLNSFVTITVTDKDAIAAIERGELKAISCGYDCTVEQDSGVWQGTPYTEVQKDIVYNHIALVSEGRAGDAVKFKVADSAEIDFKTQKGEHSMKTMLIDGVQCQADEAVIGAYQKAQKDVADIRKELEVAKAAKDAAEASLKAEKEKNSDDKIAKAVDAKLALVGKAKDLGVECDAKTEDSAIVAAVVKKAFEDVSLEGKSKDYASAMFDAACEALKKSKKEDEEKKKKVCGDSLESHKGTQDEADPELAYKQMCDAVAKNNKEA